MSTVVGSTLQTADGGFYAWFLLLKARRALAVFSRQYVSSDLVCVARQRTRSQVALGNGRSLDNSFIHSFYTYWRNVDDGRCLVSSCSFAWHWQQLTVERILSQLKIEGTVVRLKVCRTMTCKTWLYSHHSKVVSIETGDTLIWPERPRRHQLYGNNAVILVQNQEIM